MTASSLVIIPRKNGFAKPMLSIVLWHNSNQTFKKSASAAAEEEDDDEDDDDDDFTREIITQEMSIITTRTRALISNSFSSSSSSLDSGMSKQSTVGWIDSWIKKLTKKRGDHE